MSVAELTSDQPGAGEPPGEFDLSAPPGGEIVCLITVVVTTQATHLVLVRRRHLDLEEAVAIPENAHTWRTDKTV